ncbi:Clavaminate synthase-like protein [Fistulina hepatica ATCC 64428]|uniref:Clavaminate synthase-like protein n=1 Tax=Fistulina hepatica ATCC 64428 TaxID=1128425 RepID=A0A0D7AMW6_9AGAR|nr:Clavaminate synthase-like protein [Fistulina hepatica ATCC 64428]
MPSTVLPPFPDDVPAHSMIVVDFDRLAARDPDAIEQLIQASTTLGFWYLKNHGLQEVAEDFFNLGEETFQLPLEEKVKFEQGDNGNSFGYKIPGANAVNSSGERDNMEFINVAKDDVLAWPRIARRTYPSTVETHMTSVLQPFVEKSLAVASILLDVFNEYLSLPAGVLASKHTREEFSGSEARCIKAAASPDVLKVAIGAHSDFGTLTLLHNRLGGLQVMDPETNDWKYVKPLPGHIICNLGDAMAIFSGGILKSSLHRVIPPPGAQRHLDRWSAGFFVRPGNSVLLAPLTEGQRVRAAIDDGASTKNMGNLATRANETALEWFTRRIKNQRLKNRTGPETWTASRGTEAFTE